MIKVFRLFCRFHSLLWSLLGLTIGQGGQIGWNSYFLGAKNIKIGKNAKIANYCGFEAVPQGPITIGDNFHLNRNCWLASVAPITIGNDVSIGPNCVLAAYNHIFTDPKRPIASQGEAGAPIKIEDDVWLGANVVVTAGVTIHTGTIIGANAVVTKNAPPHSVLGGIPARLIKKRKGFNQSQPKSHHGKKSL